MNRFGVQLYSYTKDCELGFFERIKTSGDIGYSLVELAGGYDDLTAESVKQALDNAHVQALTAHVPLEKLEDQLEFMVTIGVKYMIVPMVHFSTKEEAKVLASELNEFGKKAIKHGIKVGYHNHTYEFAMDEGKYLLDWLFEYTDPNTVVFELDCGWTSAAGVDPVSYINAHKGRIAAIHIKENAEAIGPDTPISRNIDKELHPNEDPTRREQKERINVKQGEGMVDWKAVKAAADAQYEDDIIYIVEREVSYDQEKDRVKCLKEDALWVKENL